MAGSLTWQPALPTADWATLVRIRWRWLTRSLAPTVTQATCRPLHELPCLPHPHPHPLLLLLLLMSLLLLLLLLLPHLHLHPLLLVLLLMSLPDSLLPRPPLLRQLSGPAGVTPV